MSEDNANEISSRAVIASAAIIPVAALIAAAQRRLRPQPLRAVRRAASACWRRLRDRIIPKDDLGPSASESGVPDVHQSRAGRLSGGGENCVHRRPGGDRCIRAPVADRALSSNYQRISRTRCSPRWRAERPKGFANARAFFNRARRLTMEGMFGDPYYGGNKNFAGWDLIRYPGPRLATSAGRSEDGRRDQAVSSLRLRQAGQDHGH